LFRTELHIEASDQKITLSTPVLSVGSCFADTMGQRLQASRVPTLANPFGVLFNPLSVFALLRHSLDGTAPPAESYLTRGDLHLNYHLHSDLHALSQPALAAQVAQALAATRQHLLQSRFLVVTLGTAWVYQHQATGLVVANCHKMPQALFAKRLLTVAEVADAFAHLHTLLLAHNPHLQCLVTVSPVRHVKDTLPGNALSKSTLRLAAEAMCRLPQVHYFPAYELLLDDLRDYRFYADDMLHPSPVAQQYIWDKFANAWCHDETLAFMAQWQKVQAALAHRPLQPESQQHRAFLRQTLLSLKRLELQYPQADFTKEIATLKAQL